MKASFIPILTLQSSCLNHAQHGHSPKILSHPPTPQELTLLSAPSPSPSAPVTHNNPALRIKSEGAAREEVRGIDNGENLDKIVTFVLGGLEMVGIRSSGHEEGQGWV